MKYIHITAIMLLAIFIGTSCVSLKKYQELESSLRTAGNENSDLKARNLEYSTLNTELNANIGQIIQQKNQLTSDTAMLGEALRKTASKLSDLQLAYDSLLSRNLSLVSGTRNETRTLAADLEKTREALQKKEDELNKLETELVLKLKNLSDLQAELSDKEQKLNELQSVLNKKDSVVRALKAKVSEALLGYENKGLTVVQKNGKVYVSMEESLLFPSGRYEVTPQGTDALKKLAKVLESNSDINILVEGHTDNIPYKASGQLLDNWDLSAKRATTVIRILLTGSTIDPTRITAAGRSEYCPVDKADSPEARAKNRRTEIILSPKLDELLKIIENN